MIQVWDSDFIFRFVIQVGIRVWDSGLGFWFGIHVWDSGLRNRIG